MKMILIFSVLLFLRLAHAEVVVNSSVDRNKMGEGDTFTLTITVASDSSVSVDDPKLPVIEGFDLLNTWTESENFSSFSNGQFQVQRKQKYNYMLAPQKTGQYKIEGVSINVNGQNYNTKPIDITVVAGSAAPPPSRQKRMQNPFEEEDDLFSQFLRRRPMPGHKMQKIDPNDAFFIEVEVDKTEVFAGEQVVASFYLYTRAQISDIDTLNYPALSGFWKEDIEVATRLGFEDEVVNGIIYRKALLASYALFPIKPGDAKIDTYKAKCTVLAPTAFGFGQPAVITKQSPEINIKVKPLPEPTGATQFIGGVGKFNMNSVVDSNKVAVNQPITWKVTFAGQGNAKLIELPKVQLPEGLELYDTKSKSVFNKNGQSSKEFEILVIPRKSGDYKLPAMQWALFDADRGAYYTVQSDFIDFNVEKGADEPVLDSQPLAQSNKKTDEGPKVPELILETWSPSLVQLSTAQLVGAWSGGFVLSLLWIVIFGFREMSDKQKKKDLETVLKSKFKKINDLNDKGNWRQVGVETLNAFYNLIGEMSGLGGANLEIEKLMLKVPPSVRREMGEDLVKNLKKLEVLCFAPENVIGGLKEPKELKKLINEMETLLLKSLKLGLGKEQNHVK